MPVQECQSPLVSRNGFFFERQWTRDQIASVSSSHPHFQTSVGEDIRYRQSLPAKRWNFRAGVCSAVRKRYAFGGVAQGGGKHGQGIAEIENF